MIYIKLYASYEEVDFLPAMNGEVLLSILIKVGNDDSIEGEVHMTESGELYFFDLTDQLK